MNAFNRRRFLRSAGSLTATIGLSSIGSDAWSNKLHSALIRAEHRDAESIASDEDFWFYIQQAYTVSPSIINLNNGGVAPSPKSVQEAMKRYHDFSVEAPSYYMWRILDQGREPLRRNLANLAGCDPEELAIQRNASEALETVIFGLDLKAGDEIVLSRQDYPNMINAWKQREIRDGVKLVWVDHKLPSENAVELVRNYTSAFTSRTKVVQITHIINWNGQILPVKEIADAAKSRGIDVLVDGAHSFAQFRFNLSELNCDYFGTSLHKWLSSSIGTGFLFIRKEKIGDIYPLFAAGDPRSKDIRKFENLGTRPFYTEQAVAKAIEFYDMIGGERKEKRLLFLKNYWMRAVEKMPNVVLHTSMKPEFGCAIGMVSVNGKKPAELEQFLFQKYKIHCVAIEWENLKGVRITPNVYTSTKDLDVLIRGISEFSKSAF